MTTFLEQVLKAKRAEIRQLRRSTPDPERAPTARSLARALEPSPGGAARIIAEIKRASPSEGQIRPDLDPEETARAYEAAGAAAVSVVTERRWFHGDLGMLKAARLVVRLPVLCKDFLVDPVQVDAARAAGADACLLIAAALPGGRLAEMLATVGEHGMEALVEVHDEAELEAAVAAGARTIGVNNRDLATLSVDLRVGERLLPRIPRPCLRVAESGLAGPGHVRRMLDAGADAVLVGTALVRSGSPGEELRRWLAACG